MSLRPRRHHASTHSRPRPEDDVYNIIPVHNLLADHPSLRLPEVRAVVAALGAVGDLRKPPLNQWLPGMDLLDWLGLFFGFQKENVRNQREHLVLHLANGQMSLNPPPDNIETLDATVLRGFLKKLLKNYKDWCSYLGTQSNIRISDRGRGASDDKPRELLYVSLYLLIWGEAANLRLLPECLCYIFHHMAMEMNKILEDCIDENTGWPVTPSTTGDNGFLNFVVKPIYEKMKAEIDSNKNGTSPHSDWRNYDDINEYFWHKRCFQQLKWPIDLGSNFVMSSSKAKNLRLRFQFSATSIPFNLMPKEQKLNARGTLKNKLKDSIQRLKLRYGVGQPYRKLESNQFEATKFSMVWNEIIMSFREEDIISAREVELLQLPPNSWDVRDSIQNVPVNLEARRRISFLRSSFFMKMLRAPLVEKMMAFSVFTPYCTEDVLYSEEQLRTENEDGISMLYSLQTTFDDEWKNFMERMRREGVFRESDIWTDKLRDLRLWASYRGQTLSRTVRGIMYYYRVLKLLAFLDSASEMDLQEESSVSLLFKGQEHGTALMKFAYVVACQMYGTQKKEKDPRADEIQLLMRNNEALRVAYVDEVAIGMDEKKYYSVVVKYDQELDKEVEIYRIQLPGPMKLGEEKPENHNHAIIFSRGDAVQTIDMNQDNYFEGAIKMLNLLFVIINDSMDIVDYPCLKLTKLFSSVVSDEDGNRKGNEQPRRDQERCC